MMDNINNLNNLPGIVQRQINRTIQGNEQKSINTDNVASQGLGATVSVYLDKENGGFYQQVRPTAPSVEYFKRSLDSVPRIGIKITPVDHDELGQTHSGFVSMYSIYRNGEIIKSINSGDSLVYIDGPLDRFTTYTYQVQAFCVNGTSSYSSQYSINARDNTIPHKPVTPTVLTDGVRVDNNGDACNGILVFNQNYDPDYSQMRVYCRAIEESGWDDFASINSGANVTVNFPLKGLTKGRQYAVKINALDFSDNISEDSDSVYFVAGDNTPPDQVRRVTAHDSTTGGTHQVEITFDRPSANDAGLWDIAKYEIWRGPTGSDMSSYSKIYEYNYVDQPSIIYLDSTITAAVSYTYAVRAIDASGNASKYSFSNAIATAIGWDSPLISVVHDDGDTDIPITVAWSFDFTGTDFNGFQIDVNKYYAPPALDNAPVFSDWITNSGVNSGVFHYNIYDFPYLGVNVLSSGEVSNYYVKISAVKRTYPNSRDVSKSKLVGKETFTYNPVPADLTNFKADYNGQTDKIQLSWDTPTKTKWDSYLGLDTNLEIRYFGTNSGADWTDGVVLARTTGLYKGYSVNAPSENIPDVDTTYYYGAKAVATRSKSLLNSQVYWSKYGQTAGADRCYYSTNQSQAEVTFEGKIPIPTGIVATGDKQLINIKWNEVTKFRLSEYVLYISAVSAADLNSPVEAQIAFRGNVTQIPINKMPNGTQLSSAPKEYWFKLRVVDHQRRLGDLSDVFSAITTDAIGPSIDVLSTVPALEPYTIINSNQIQVNWMTTDETSNLSEVWGRITQLGQTAGAWQKNSGYSGGTQSGHFIFTSLVTGNFYNYELRALDSAANAAQAARTFEVDSTQAANPDSIVLSQISKDTIGVQVNYATLPAHFKNLDVYYRTNSGDWSYLDSRSSMAFSETVPANGYIDMKIIATKLHDAALNSPGSVYSNAILLDSIAPNFQATKYTSDVTADRLLGVGGGSTSAIRVDFSLTDGGSGLDDDSLLVAFDAHLGNAFTNSGVTYNGSDPSSRTGQYINSGIGDGAHSLIFKSIDLAGNYTFTEPRWIEVDTAAPDAPTDPVAYAQGRSVYVSTSSPTQINNFKEYQWYVNSGSSDDYLQTSADRYLRYTFPADIATQVNFKAKQVKRNGVEGALSNASNSVWIDTTPPVVTISAVSNINAYGYTKENNVSVTFSATDTGGSGVPVGGYAYSLNGAAWSAATSPQAISLSTQSGQMVQVKATDNAGNEAIAQTIFKRDSVAPSAPSSFAALFQRDIQWSWSSSTDDNSGVAGYEVRSADSDWGAAGYIYQGQANGLSTIPTNSGDVSYFIKAFDYAGNYSSVATVTAHNVEPHAVGAITTSSELNGVQFSWDAITTDADDLATNDIIGYDYRTKVGASATFPVSWSTTSTNSVFRALTAPERLQADLSIYAEVKTRNFWGKLATNSGAANAQPIKIEFVNMGSNPMQFEVWVNSGTGIVTQTENPLFLNLVNGSFKD